MKKVAFVFPGQGSQSIGMLDELAAQYPVVQATFDEASAVVGLDLWALRTGSQTDLKNEIDQTEITQPLLLAADIAVYRCWQEAGGVSPVVLGGHSLGEYAALVVAQALRFAEAMHLVRQRGRYMQAAVPENTGAMGAVVGLEEDKIIELCRVAAQGEVLSPANFNSIGQTVIAGTVGAVERALVAAKVCGAKIAKRIAVSVPSHCALMASAAEQLTRDLANTLFLRPQFPVLHNVDASVHTEACDLRQVLNAQLTQPVRWVQTIQNMVAEYGVTHIVECGPGKVLAGLIKRIDPSVPTYSIGLSLADFQTGLSTL